MPGAGDESQRPSLRRLQVLGGRHQTGPWRRFVYTVVHSRQELLCNVRGARVWRRQRWGGGLCEEEAGLGRSPWRKAWPLKMTTCVASSKLFNLSVPQFPHLENGITATHSVIDLSGGLNKEHVKQLGERHAPRKCWLAAITTTTGRLGGFGGE